MKTLRTFVVLLCLALFGAILPAGAAQAAVAQQGTYYPVASARLLDTRPGPKLGPNSTLELPVAGHGGIPATGVAAVVINLTATGGSSNSYLTVYPSGLRRPVVSSINFLRGTTRANSATVPLGSGAITIYNLAGSVSVLVDVVGFYASAVGSPAATGAEFIPLAPGRLLDTRRDPAGPLEGTGGSNVLTMAQAFGTNGDLSANVRALALNITAVKGARSGYLTAWDAGPTIPRTSTLNFVGATPTPNLAVVKTAVCSTANCPAGSPPSIQFAILNGSPDPVDVIVDLVGLYAVGGGGLRFVPVTPTRISDSRIALNGAPLAAGVTQTRSAPTSVATADTIALVSNVTAVTPTRATYFTLWAPVIAGVAQPKPGVSNLNASTGAVVANGAIVGMSDTNTFSIVSLAGTSNFLVDVTGRFGAPAASTALQRARTSGFSSVTTGSNRRAAALRVAARLRPDSPFASPFAQRRPARATAAVRLGSR